MLSPKADDYRLIGIVDNDKKLNIHCKGFFGTFETVSQYERLTLKKHPIKDQYIIIVDKAVETFLLWNAEAVGMAVSQYGFDTSPKKFGLQLKTPTIETDPSYLQLLNDLYQHQAPGLLTLESLLHGFIEGTP
ncbi:MAG: hypothetical protein EAZ91_08735 [Cytophagales bacterium]|nr:MAG: hypothetical protein EAZ91_08735 [Cytophagales bacterium]